MSKSGCALQCPGLELHIASLHRRLLLSPESFGRPTKVSSYTRTSYSTKGSSDYTAYER